MVRLNRIGWMCAAVVLGAMTVTSFAQAPAAGGAGGAGGGGRQGRGGQGRGGQRGQRGFGMLTVDTIPAGVLQGALGLSTDQTAKIATIQTKQAADMKALFAPPAAGEQPDPAARQANFQKFTEMRTANTAAINAILTEDQKAKLPAAIKDLQVYQGLRIPLEVLPEVKFSADQKKQIAAIAEEHTKAMADARANNQGDRPGQQAATQAANMASQTKLMAVISPEQKTIIEKYIKDHPQPAFGRGGPGRRGGGGAPGGAAPGGA